MCELKSFGLYVINNIVITFSLGHEKSLLIQEALLMSVNTSVIVLYLFCTNVSEAFIG